MNDDDVGKQKCMQMTFYLVPNFGTILSIFSDQLISRYINFRDRPNPPSFLLLQFDKKPTFLGMFVVINIHNCIHFSV